MKIVVKVILLCTLFMSLHSCAIEESIIFNENGSGSYAQGISLQSQKIEALFNPDEENTSERFIKDTVMYFKDLMKEEMNSGESFTEEQKEYFEAMKDYRMRVHMDSHDLTEMMFETEFNNFTSFSENLLALSEMFKGMKSGNAEMGGLSAMMQSPLEDEEPPIVFEMNEDSFVRKVDFSQWTQERREKFEDEIQKGLMDLQNVPKEEGSEFVEYFESIQMNFSYSFPKKIKQVNLPLAQISEDRHSIKMSVPLFDYYQNMEEYNLIVTFE